MPVDCPSQIPGECPISVGECLGRIIGRAIVQCTKMDILRVIGDQQLCVSHMAGCEAAIHTLTDIFETDESATMLFVDTLNSGRPLGDAFYAIATIPLIENLRQDTLHIWYADDPAGAG